VYQFWDENRTSAGTEIVPGG